MNTDNIPNSTQRQNRQSAALRLKLKPPERDIPVHKKINRQTETPKERLIKDRQKSRMVHNLKRWMTKTKVVVAEDEKLECTENELSTAELQLENIDIEKEKSQHTDVNPETESEQEETVL